MIKYLAHESRMLWRLLHELLAYLRTWSICNGINAFHCSTFVTGNITWQLRGDASFSQTKATVWPSNNLASRHLHTHGPDSSVLFIATPRQGFCPSHWFLSLSFQLIEDIRERWAQKKYEDFFWEKPSRIAMALGQEVNIVRKRNWMFSLDLFLYHFLLKENIKCPLGITLKVPFPFSRCCNWKPFIWYLS